MNNLFDIPQLLKLRKNTNIISSYLEHELKCHITTLSPLFYPKLIFGDYISGTKQSVKNSSSSFKKLKDLYQSLQQNQLFYDRLDELKPPMDVFASALEFSPYEYDYQATSEDDSKTIRIVSPLKWILGYKNQGIIQLKELLNDRTGSRNTDMHICVLHHLIMHLVCSKREDVIQLFSALRFEVYSEPSAEYGNIPFIIISCPIRTILPSDELIIQSTELSGLPIFEEIINIDDINNLTDPYKEQLINLLNDNQ